MATDINKAATVDEVKMFLNELRQKLEFQLVNFDHRGKNLDSYVMLSEWGYSANDRINFIKKLTPENYSEGPKPDDQNVPTKGPLWIFGKFIKPRNPKRKKEETEFYIKVQIGWPNKEVICISFHPSVKPMEYPLIASGNE